MSRAVITCLGSSSIPDAPFTPGYQVALGDGRIVKYWLVLDGNGQALLKGKLERDGVGDVNGTFERLLLRYGVRRLEAQVVDALVSDTTAEMTSNRWDLGGEDLPALLALAEGKTCEYQARVRRDLFCLIPTPQDETARYIIEGRPAGATSSPICRQCELPDTDYVCASLLHPESHPMNAASGLVRRHLAGAVCDLGRREVSNVFKCRPGGNACWQRIVEAEAPTFEPVSPLGLIESFDILDAYWRMAFGRNKRLVSPTTMVGPAGLMMGCESRVEFESRLSALADAIDKLKVDRDLLPSALPDDAIKGSLNKVERCLLHQLDPVQHQAVTSAVQILRRVHGARNSVQHGITEGGGLAACLRSLGIHDAPPNWSGAWDSIRAQSAQALTTLRNELRVWVDATT